MFNATFKKLALAGTVAVAFALTGCLQGEDTAQTQVPDMHLKVSATVDAVNKSGSLGKGNMIALAKVIIQLTSNATPADTIRDTVTPGEQGFVATSTITQSIDSNYVVKGLRTWKVVVTVRDTKDSIIQRDSTTPGSFTKVADTVAATVNLTSRFAMFRAIFGPLPDSISSATGPNKQQIKFKRLILKVDGVIKDSLISASGFTAGGLDTLYSDYITVNVAHTVRLIAYGPVGATYNDSIFAATSPSFTPTPGTDASLSTLPLVWCGPNTGVEKLVVNIGKVGTTTLAGTTSGTGVVPKSR